VAVTKTGACREMYSVLGRLSFVMDFFLLNRIASRLCDLLDVLERDRDRGRGSLANPMVGPSGAESVDALRGVSDVTSLGIVTIPG